MGLAKEVTPEQKGAIFACQKLGITQEKTAEIAECSQPTVSRVLKSNNQIINKRPGRPQIMTVQKRKKLVEAVLKNKNSRRQSLKEVCQLFSNQNRGKEVSKRTIQKALRMEGIRSCIPRPKPLISPINKAKRLAFAIQHQNYTMADWRKVIWSDESTFSQFQTSGWGRVWRMSDEEFHEDCIASTVKHSPKRMFWGCFSWFGLGPIIPLVGPVTGKTYRDVLETYAVPTLKEQARKVRKKFVFQEDNAPVHTAKVARDFLNLNNVALLPWPPQSPDLNPIEELWSIVESGLRKRKPGPSNIQELEKMIIEEWKSIPKETYRSLISSMPSRIQAVISAKGGHTKY
jgi:transposase/predicted transcriptional regulator